VDKRKYTSTVINANYKASLWMGLSALLLVSNVMLAGFVLTADTSEKTIVVPPQLDQPFSIQGHDVGPEYIEQMARYFSQLLLTYHKQNAQAQFDTVLHYTDPSVYSEMKTRFALDRDRISRNDISSVFYLMGIHIKKQVAIISGELNGYVGSHLVSTQQKTYALHFHYDNQLRLTGFNELQQDSMGSYEVVKPDDEVMIETPVSTAPAALPVVFNNGEVNHHE
jgi:conjugal transfer pilus assembly protein TraE